MFDIEIRKETNLAVTGRDVSVFFYLFNSKQKEKQEEMENMYFSSQFNMSHINTDFTSCILEVKCSECKRPRCISSRLRLYSHQAWSKPLWLCRSGQTGPECFYSEKGILKPPGPKFKARRRTAAARHHLLLLVFTSRRRCGHWKKNAVKSKSGSDGRYDFLYYILYYIIDF